MTVHANFVVQNYLSGHINVYAYPEEETIKLLIVSGPMGAPSVDVALGHKEVRELIETLQTALVTMVRGQVHIRVDS